jgi:glycosyltransferase involved in cell wall biosynthesis
MPELFSLLLPVYRNDRPDFLAAAFASTVVHQDRPPAEVIFVRDGPIGRPLVAELARITLSSPVPVKVVELDENVGLAKALAEGLDHCSFDVVARMDADDISYSNRFALQLPMIESGFDLVGSAMHEFVVDERGTRKVVGVRTPPREQRAIAAQMPFHNPFNHPTVVFRKSVVARSGGYLPLGVMEDYWLFARMLAAGARAHNVADPLVAYRTDAGAYARRGGLGLLRSELKLQKAFRRARITTRGQFLRNVLIRGGYRLVPEGLRRAAYRRTFVSGTQGV